MNTPTSGPGAQPLLSIVVLVYNTAQYLAECFDSLLNQRYDNIEIIVIDDGSTDGSLAICQEYERRQSNFRCIKKHNEGGAASGNLGISLARGEYVSVVDSDDMVTTEGYRMLMDEALRTNADIVIGRAARLTDGVISSVAFLYEPYVWSQRQVFDSVSDFPDVVHDCFYWNKIFRTAFLRDNGLGMVPGLLYADRPFVHRAYWYSRRTAIIPNLVYYWRSRLRGSERSITQNIHQADNFADRVRSMMIEWHDFEDIAEAAGYREMIAVCNLQRAIYAAPGIVASPIFRKAFVEWMQKLIALYGDLDWRELGVRRCLYLELIRRGEIEALCFLLGVTTERGWIAEIDDACYWQQPFLDNPEIQLPREVMRLNFPCIGFFQLLNITLNDVQLALTLHLHDRIMDRCEVEFELHSIHCEGGWRFESLGREDQHRWRYTLDLRACVWEPGALYGVVLHYRTIDGIRGRYRIGQKMVPPEWLPTLPLTSIRGNLLFSPEAGGIGFVAHTAEDNLTLTGRCQPVTCYLNGKAPDEC